ncbi:saccharopine dehydrogenase-like oxidoreductase [Musca vetustissima]|uniref:saccharopine dehydrogenase-like oxidoreductase n=1 Tax=Musca vetustissima TaxID=27455 RepID=UPI002AB772CA|nr:saccharopine dehydrogenase-like oxidoreductase [Musca vetustissima]
MADYVEFAWGKKLEAVLEDMGTKANKNLKNTPIIIADIDDQSSLLEMAKRCRVLVNCCGPYRFYGEPVVRACIEAGTHHVDVSGEPQYMETMQLKYHKEAQERNVYVVSACGFDSITADMGIVFIEKNFDGIVNSVETYLQSYTKGGSNSGGGAGIHFGTWESAVYGLAHANELRGIRQKLYSEKMPRFEPVLKHRPLIFRSEIVNGVCLPFPGSDRSVVMRSQRFIYEQEKKRPVQMHAYVAFGSYVTACLVALAAVSFGLLAKFSLGRRLLLKYPRLFSFGFVSHEGPSEAAMERTYFAMTMKALGWPKTDNNNPPSGAPTKSLIAIPN